MTDSLFPDHDFGVPPDARMLADEFIVPPFSVLDCRAGVWQTRKGEWVSFFQRLGLDPSEGRAGDLLMGEGTMKSLRGSATVRTSIFDPVLCEIAYAWFVPERGRVFDPFAGGPMRGIVAGKMGLDYIGTDIREEQVVVNRRHAAKVFGDGATAKWIASDAREMEIPPCDFVFSCPPYGDLEGYSDDPRDISTMDRAGFLAAYRAIIAASAGALVADRFAVFVVGNYRDKGGFLCDLCGDTVRAFEDAGLRYYCDGSLATAIGSASMRARKIFAGRKLTRIHQNVLVFVKGDPKRAAGEVKGHVAAHVKRAGGDKIRRWLG